jgi:hypothetical protein
MMSGPLGSNRGNLFDAMQNMPGQAPMTAGAPGTIGSTGGGIFAGTGVSPIDFERMTFGKNDRHYLNHFLGRQIGWQKYNVARDQTGDYATRFTDPSQADNYMKSMDVRRADAEHNLRAAYTGLQSVGLFKGTSIDKLPVQSNANIIRRLLEKGPKGNRDLIEMRKAYKRVENAPDPEGWEKPPPAPKSWSVPPATGGPMTPGHLPPGTMYANSGGSVPGIGNTDSIPAMLTPGEYVINAQAAGKHAALLSSINNGTATGFNSGGPVKYLSTGSNRPIGSSGDGTKGMRDAANILSNTFTSFEGMGKAISDALSSFSIGTITHEHTHTFTGTVNFDIVGSDIADELQDKLNAIGQQIAKAQVVSALEKMSEGQAPGSIAVEMRGGGGTT